MKDESYTIFPAIVHENKRSAVVTNREIIMAASEVYIVIGNIQNCPTCNKLLP